MLIEQPVSHIDQKSIDPATIDWLDLTWSQCLQRAHHRKTRAGKEIRILLRIGLLLRHGDILIDNPMDGVIAVNLLPCDLLVAHPSNETEAASIAYKLGDLHVPVQLDHQLILTLPDGPTEAAMSELGVPYQIESRRFQPTLRSITEIVLAPNFKVMTIPKIAGEIRSTAQSERP